MKTQTLIQFNLFLVGILTFIGHKKYEKTPKLSIDLKKSRVKNVWKFKKVFIYTGNKCTPSGTDVSSYYYDQYIEFKKDGSFIWYGESSSNTGTWIFASDNEDIALTENGSGSTDTYQIIKFEENEFWLRRENTFCYECTVEYHLSLK